MKPISNGLVTLHDENDNDKGAFNCMQLIKFLTAEGCSSGTKRTCKPKPVNAHTATNAIFFTEQQTNCNLFPSSKTSMNLCSTDLKLAITLNTSSNENSCYTSTTFKFTKSKQTTMSEKFEINLFVKRLHPDAVIPTYAHPSDAGLDLTATTRTDDNNGNIIYGTGLAIEIPSGCVGLIFPRSSIRKTSLFQANGVSVIDSGYRGEITVTMRKYINPDTKEYNPDAQYQPGERIAQLIVMPYPPCRIAEMNELSTSERGTKGYGSTGK